MIFVISFHQHTRQVRKKEKRPIGEKGPFFDIMVKKKKKRSENEKRKPMGSYFWRWQKSLPQFFTINFRAFSHDQGFYNVTRMCEIQSL